MRVSRPTFGLFVLLLLPFAAGPANAQSGTSGSGSSRPTEGYDRLFLAFVEDATVIDRQWWEGQIEFADSDNFDVSLIRGVVALQPWRDVEVGARVGFGNSDTPSGIPDGTGGTDLDLWGKYYFTNTRSRNAEFAVGSVVTIPTGDDAAGLGFDSFRLSAFGAARVRFPSVILNLHAGIRFNGDGQVFGVDLDGETSVMGGVGVIVPFSDRVNLVGEAVVENERFEGADTDFRVLGGLNWRSTNRGMLRAAVAVGLADGSPDAQILLGYATRF